MSSKANFSVAIVTHYYSSHRGGVEIVAGSLAALLAAELDSRIRWFASDSDAPPTNWGVECTPIKAWNWIERATGLPYPLWSPRGLVGLWRAISRVDVVHLHDYIYFGNLFAFAASRWYRKPIVVTQHIGAIPYRNRALRSVLEIANRTVGRMVLGHANHVVFISHEVREYFSGFTAFRNAPLYWPNGVDTEVFREASAKERQDIRITLGLSVDRPLVLFVGRFVEKKGLHILQQLASRLPEVDWLFAGWGPMHPDRWGLRNVRVMEGRAGDTLRPLYQVADLLVLPSTGEGFPLVVQEAMASGTPAMVSDTTAKGSPESGPLLFAEPVHGDDVLERWENRIRSILAQNPHLLDMRAKVATFARQHWSSNARAAAYGSLISQLASESPGRPR